MAKDYLTLSSDVRMFFGIQAAHIIINGNDIMIMLRQINDEAVIFDCPEIDIKLNEPVLIKFNSKYGPIEIDLKIMNFCSNEFMFSIEGKITGINQEEFLIALKEFLKKLIQEKKRKEERILCNQANLAKLNLINNFEITFHSRIFKCIIKDISLSGLKFFTGCELLHHKGEKFNIKLKFKNPEHTFFFTDCEILRKDEYVFNGMQLCEAVLKLEPNIKFASRINMFFNEDYKELKKEIKRKK